MRVTVYANWKSMDDFCAGLPADAEKSFEYSGPVAQCLRQQVAQATQAAQTAAGVGAGYGAEAGGELGVLSPFYTREMQAKHAFDPSQLNELLTAAGAGAGGVTGAAQGALQRQAASTGNVAGQTKALQELARDRMKAQAGASEGIAGEDVLGAQKLQQEGAAGMQGLYGTNVKAQLEAMGQVAPDVQAATQASKTGWLQQAEQLGTTAADIYKTFKG